MVAALDALVLVGGEDVGDNPLRDRSELSLLAAAAAVDLPVLAVCRGHQLLNVQRGGTLVPHLPDLPGTESHRPEPGQFSPVAIEAEADSRVASAMGKRFTVSCSHHQAIDILGKGLLVTARSAGGVIEAVEDPGAAFLVGVQWHPEEEGDIRLFNALMGACGHRRPSGRVHQR